MSEFDKKSWVSDIKLTFDALRNVGIASVVFYGSIHVHDNFPVVIEAAPLNTFFAIFTVVISLILYVGNFWWFLVGLQGKPHSKFMHYLGALSVVVFTTIAFVGSQYKAVFNIIFTEA